MGVGKTQAAITMMNENGDKRYLFVTPYLEEVTRIKRSCPGRNFVEPESRGESHTKLDDLHDLLVAGENIASTHALFAYYSSFTVSLIRERGYTLVLDEVMNVIEMEKISKSDIQLLFDSKTMEMADDGIHVRWLDDNYRGSHQSIMKKAQLGNLIYYKESLMFWSLPVSSFDAFEEVYILTYLFDAQMQRYYYDINQVELEYIGSYEKDGTYRFTSQRIIPEYAWHLKDHVHILDDDKLNRIGDMPFTLSSGWYKKARAQKGSPMLEVIRKNVYNVFRHKFQCPSMDLIWTTFKLYKDFIGKSVCKGGFVPCSMRATNAYRDRHYLAYCINVYFNPALKNYFLDHHVRIDEDTYALSEMVQWIWRSAIRCGEDIWIYIPSKRMRTLLQNWLQDLANAPATIPAA